MERFINNGDGTVTDAVTKLMWQQETSENWMMLDNAIEYAKNLELAGYSDWRIPTIEELETIVDEGFKPKMNPVFENRYAAMFFYFWSSSPFYQDGCQYYWYVDFSVGEREYYNPFEYYYIRCVRNI